MREVTFPQEDVVVAWPPVGALLLARLTPHRWDRMLAAGAFPTPGSALAVHAARITSVRERESIARVLRRCLTDPGVPVLCSRVAYHARNVRAAESVIDDITLRLHSPRPVSAVGVARLRRVLVDGLGPLYAGGRGDLRDVLRAAFVEL